MKNSSAYDNGRDKMAALIKSNDMAKVSPTKNPQFIVAMIGVNTLAEPMAAAREGREANPTANENDIMESVPNDTLIINTGSQWNNIVLNKKLEKYAS